MEHSDNTDMVVEKNETSTNAKNQTKILMVGLIVAFILVLTGLGAGTVYGVYRGSENPIVVTLATVFQVPVARVNGDPILYSEYMNDLRSLRTFYEENKTQATFTKEQQSDQVLSRLIAKILVEQTAREFTVVVNDEDREKAKKDILSRFDNDEQKLTEDLKKNLGITLPEFYRTVMEPTLLEKKVGENFSLNSDVKYSAYNDEQIKARHILFSLNAGESDAKVKAKAKQVLDQIKKGGDFAALAKQHGSDGTKDAGGDLGWFGKGEMVPEFEAAAFSLKKGELAKEPVKSQFGYHIIRVDDMRTAKNFSNFMNDRLKKSELKVLGSIHNPFENLANGE